MKTEVFEMSTPITLRRRYASAALAILLTGNAWFNYSVAQVPSEPYQVRPGDKLSISVWKEEELQAEIVVRPDGGLTFPLAGELSTANKSVSEIADEIADRLERYIPQAVVTVTLMEIRGARVYVIGQVGAPGALTVDFQIDVMQALSMAGGLTPFAAANDIRILRRETDGQIAIPFEYDRIVRGRDLEQNILLQDGDVIVVP